MRINREQVRRHMLRQEIQTFGELAERVGVTPASMSLWFKGGAFTAYNLGQLCRILRCTPNDILIWDEDIEENTPPVVAKPEKKEQALAGVMA